MDFDFSLPSFGDSGSWSDTSNYNLGSSNINIYTPVNDDWWSEPSQDTSSNIWDSVWGWANTEMGVNVLSGAIKAGASMIASDQNFKNQKEMIRLNNTDSAAKTARINIHNQSINTPMDLKLRNFKKP